MGLISRAARPESPPGLPPAPSLSGAAETRGGTFRIVARRRRDSCRDISAGAVFSRRGEGSPRIGGTTYSGRVGENRMQVRATVDGQLVEWTAVALPTLLR